MALQGPGASLRWSPGHPTGLYGRCCLLRVHTAGRQEALWLEARSAPKGVGMPARPHQGRTWAVLRKLAPEASSLNTVRSSLRGSKEKKPRYQGRKCLFQGGLCAFGNRLEIKAAVLEEGRSSRQAARAAQPRTLDTNTRLGPHQQGSG